MQKKIYYKLISIPIILIITVISLITFYNIDSWIEHKEEAIKELTQEYTKKHQEKVKYNVTQLINDIEFARINHLNIAKDTIKNQVEKLLASLESNYEHDNKIKSQEQIKSDLLNIIRSQNTSSIDNYFFVTDLNTSKSLVHNIPKLEGTLLKNKKDLKGTLTFQSKVDILKIRDASFQTLYFEKPSQPNKQFKKLVYFKKFKHLNWIVGTGVYLENENAKIQQKILEKYKNTQTDLDNYIFISQLHNIEGGKDFATILFMPNNPNLVGKKISDNKVDAKKNYHRKSYLKLLKKEGSGYIDYWYKKPNTQIEAKKESYMFLYKPWNWIIGSGFYFDDLEDKINKKEKFISKELTDKIYQALFIGLLFIIISSILFYSFAKSIVTVINEYIEKVDKQKNTFQSLFENTTDGIMLIRDGYIFNCNNAVLKMFGFSEKNENIIGKTAYELSSLVQKDGISSKEKALIYMENCLNNNHVNFQWIHKRVNGEEFDAEITFTKIILDNKEIIHAVLRDISQKNALMKEAKEKDTILIQQSKMASMGEMIGNIAHQWRQPLNALGLTIQKIKMYHDEGLLSTQELNKSVEKSQILINKMSVTIDDFRNFFKVEKTQQKFSINDAIQNTTFLLESSLTHHNITIEIDAKEEITHMGHKNELEQVLLNLINNSKDALIDDNIKNPQINIKLSNSVNFITIEVCDNAKGISKNIIDKIFEPYFTTKEQGKGTGIGLYMSKMIIENNMNGNLKVTNNTDGACFTIQLTKEITNE